MKRAYSVFTVKEFDEERRELSGIASTPSPDRLGDVVEPKGAIFKLPIPLLWHHQSMKPIGHVTEATIGEAGIEVKARIERIEEPGTLKDRLDEAWQSIKIGLVRGLSIGFNPVESARIENTWAEHFLKWEWLELSAVTIPANADASITAIKSADHLARAATGAKGLPVVRASFPGASGHVVARRTGVVYLKP